MEMVPLSSNSTRVSNRSLFDLTKCKTVKGITVKADKTSNKAKTNVSAVCDSKMFIDATLEGAWSLTDLHEQSTQIDFWREDELTELSSEQDLLLWAVQTINESPVATALLDNAMAQGWNICLEETGADTHLLYIEDRDIVLDKNGLDATAIIKSPYFRNNLLINLIASLRDIWHETNIGDMIFDYSPEDILMLERIKAADITTTTVHVCWELRSAGFSEIWRYMLGSQQGDMAMAYARRLEKEALSMFNGNALSDAFYNWFENESRVNPCDHDTLEMIDDYIQENHHLSATKKLNGSFIGLLTSLPNGTSYLQEHGHDILQNPHFAGCKNEINQAHLFHIMYDMKVHRVCGVPFRDEELARKIFPVNV